MTVYQPINHSPLIRSILCDNPSPFTHQGTNCYIVGRGEVVVIDPGPMDMKMLAAIELATKGEVIKAVLITHTHKDHSPLAAKINAPKYGYGKHFVIPASHKGSITLDSSGDMDFTPDIFLKDAEQFEIAGLAFEAVITPGHCANHLCFAFKNENILFSGDHVMGWSTSIVAPPDGNMADYMASLEKLIGREETRYFCGHGDPIETPQNIVRAMLGHRKMREASILERLREGDTTVIQIVETIYKGLNPKLFGAACINVYAHLEKLIDEGKAKGEKKIEGKFTCH
jgi:glyoxylase-like metal-dependent hydrolase (beta-lactamase superfamily II)